MTAADPGATTDRPLPRPDGLTQPYWDAARDGRLVVQRCARCRRRYHPPVPICPDCSSDDLAYEAVSGRGHVKTHISTQYETVAGFGEAPVLVWVTLDDDPEVIVATNFVSDDGAGPEFGQAVEVVFERLTDDISLPQFRAAR